MIGPGSESSPSTPTLPAEPAATTAAAAAVMPTIDISLKIPQIALALINEATEIPPLLRIGIYDFAIAGSFPEALKVTLEIKGAYYNLYRGAWDPLLVLWPLEVSVSDSVVTMAIKVSAERPLAVNATAELLNALTVWSKDFEQSRDGGYRAVLIRNFSGSRLTYYLSSSGKKTPYVVEAGRSAPLSIAGADKLKEVYITSASLDGLGKLSDLDVFKQQTKLFEFGSGKQKEQLLYKVKFTAANGQRVVTFGSTSNIRNNTEKAFDVRVEQQGLKPLVVTVHENEDWTTPMSYERGKISSRPNDKCQWSNAIDCGRIEQLKYSVVLKDENARNYYYSVLVDVEELVGGDVFTFKVAPPLVLENLLPVRVHYEIDNVEGIHRLGKGKDMHIHAASNDDAIKVKLNVEGYTCPTSIDINDPDLQMIELLDSQNV
jgi:hypothetical protein